MITLDVLSVNGNTVLANATYPVYERNVVYGFENPSDSGQTILIYEDTKQTTVELLVDDDVTDVVTALTGGDIDNHLEVTFKKIEGKDFAFTGLINLNRIVDMYDQSSDANFTVYSPAWQNPKTFITNDVSATIAAGGGDDVVFESHTVLAVNSLATTGQTRYANELFVRNRFIGYGMVQTQATGAALMQLETVTIEEAGEGYEIDDVLTVEGGTGTAATLTVTHLEVVGTPVIVAGGTGGTPGAVTITGTTGTGTKFEATGTINGSGVLEGALTLTVGGDYTVAPTDIAEEPVTGGGLSDATVEIVMGVKTVALTTAGSYSALPGATGITTTGGAGTGFEFGTDYEVDAITITNPGAGYRSATITISGGGGTGATATAAITNGQISSTTLTAAGNNFTGVPTVAITAPNAGDAIEVAAHEMNGKIYTY